MSLHTRARLRGLRRRLRTAARPRGEPILVYQMGKVGSSTVYRSLRSLGLRRQVHHVHLLNELDEIEAGVRRRYPDPVGTLAQIEKGRRLRRRILRSRRTTWNVISLVRDPVQRNVSAFFESLTEVIPDVYDRRARGDIALTDVKDAFLDRFDHDAPLNWFQSQLEPVFGIDVYATAFDAENGYATYEAPGARLLVIRLENLMADGETAISEFLGLDDFVLVPANIARDKRYADLYSEFERSVTLPGSYLERMYESRFARHFYRAAEIAAFEQRWTKAAR